MISWQQRQFFSQSYRRLVSTDQKRTVQNGLPSIFYNNCNSAPTQRPKRKEMCTGYLQRKRCSFELRNTDKKAATPPAWRGINWEKKQQTHLETKYYVCKAVQNKFGQWYYWAAFLVTASFLIAASFLETVGEAGTLSLMTVETAPSALIVTPLSHSDEMGIKISASALTLATALEKEC